jgi:hypothetical protein
MDGGRRQDHGGAGHRERPGDLAVDEEGPDGVEHGLEEQEQRRLERGHAADGAREEDVGQRDLEDAEEGDDAEVHGADRGGGEGERECDQEGERVPGDGGGGRGVRVGGRAGGEPAEADEGEGPGDPARGGEDVAEDGVGGGRARGLLADEEEDEADGERDEEEEVAPAQGLV